MITCKSLTFIRLRFSFLAVSIFLRCGSVKSVARQNPPIQSAELPSRIHMAKGMPSTSLQDWNAATAPLLPQKRRWYDAGWIPVQIGLHEAAALRPWMLVPESLVALAAEVRLTYIGVSKTNDHSRGLTVPVQKTELVQTKVK
ncbi:Hypothetical_protein [Hexamita inflata]|uniref:Hypothetical_protein n=1 Tax=Hexamita inflata TaxID=28002 RepID=A0AA86NZ32_9EUKA|nr:Hypothetical protein HINF_LOCUS15056 [Hexamita inflata]